MRLYILLVFDSFVLQPLRCLFGAVLRCCWWPPKVFTVPPARYTQDELINIAYTRIASLDRNVYGQGGDSAKFLGMLAAATDGERDWQNVMRLVKSDGTIKRNLQEQYPDDSVPFSGDMLAGFLSAVVMHLPRLTHEERALLGKLWQRTTWEGFPLLFANATTGKKSIFGRGHVWRPWWLLGSEEVLTTLAWLYCGWQITGESRYKTAYYAFLILQFPGLLFGCPDGQLWISRVYAIATYNTHSKALVFYAGWLLTGGYVFKAALTKNYNRHAAYNADIAVLAGSAIDAPGWQKIAHNLISGAVAKGRYQCPQDTKYLSIIWPPEMVMRAGTILPPEYRGGDYVWERNPIKGSLLDDNDRARKGLDVIFPALMLERLSK